MFWDLLASNFSSWTSAVKNAIDILLLAFLFYYVFLLIKGTRAVQIIQGVFVILLVMLLSYYFKLKAIYWLLQRVILALAVAIPIIFQPELRRALEHIGRRGKVFSIPVYKFGRFELTRLIDEVTWACELLSQSRTGALIVFERETGLEEFIETGVRINAEVTSKLLVSIFLHQSPLHDGAAVIRAGKLLAASCYLPLTENIRLTMEGFLGSRHRAAIGISEQTDAVVIVVSEESGKVSIARGGRLTKNLSEDQLKKVLNSFLILPRLENTGRKKTKAEKKETEKIL